MPKLKDKIYGEMNWEQWEDDYGFWFSRIKDEEYESFDLLIRAASPMSFLAAGNTHQIFEDLLLNLPSIRNQAVQRIFKNTRLFPKKKERNHVKKVFEQMLELTSIMIFEDLSSEIGFVATVLKKKDSRVVVFVGSECEFLDVSFETD